MSELGRNATAHRISVPGLAEPVKLSWAALSDRGRRRSGNEDSYVVAPPLFAVADGMGGHSAGDLASAAVVERLAESITGDFGTIAQLEAGLAAATDDIIEIAGDSEIGVGTTVTGAVLVLVDDQPYFAVFNIGDSRVYAFERNELVQVTTDHSVVQELVDAGPSRRTRPSTTPTATSSRAPSDSARSPSPTTAWSRCGADCAC